MDYCNKRIQLTAVIARWTALPIRNNWFAISDHRGAFFRCTSFTASNAKTYFTWIRLIGG